MPLGYSSNIQAEVDSADVNFIDLFEIDLTSSVTVYWCHTLVPAAQVVAHFPSKFEARVMSAGNRSWELGLNDDTITLEVSNADGALTALVATHGTEIFEGAIVKHWRYFPSLDEKYQVWKVREILLNGMWGIKV